MWSVDRSRVTQLEGEKCTVKSGARVYSSLLKAEGRLGVHMIIVMVTKILWRKWLAGFKEEKA